MLRDRGPRKWCADFSQTSPPAQMTPVLLTGLGLVLTDIPSSNNPCAPDWPVLWSQIFSCSGRSIPDLRLCASHSGLPFLRDDPTGISSLPPQEWPWVPESLSLISWFSRLMRWGGRRRYFAVNHRHSCPGLSRFPSLSSGKIFLQNTITYPANRGLCYAHITESLQALYYFQRILYARLYAFCTH